VFFIGSKARRKLDLVQLKLMTSETVEIERTNMEDGATLRKMKKKGRSMVSLIKMASDYQLKIQYSRTKYNGA
jgi:hypothetical protein